MPEKAPAFQWYPKDILTSMRVATMSLQEEGAYRRAIDFCWLHESLPVNPKELAKVIGKGCSEKIATLVATMFTEIDGRLRHDRLDEERLKQENWRAKTSAGGKKSAEKRWGSNNLNVTTVITKAASELPDSDKSNVTLHSSVSSLHSSSSNNYHQQHYDRFFSAMAELDRENIAVQRSPKAFVTNKEGKEYNAHLHTESVTHEQYSAWLSHLRNWLNTKPAARQPKGPTEAGIKETEKTRSTWGQQ